jgi:photosystem II stability/assembly factor-like uncharacterized protein
MLPGIMRRSLGWGAGLLALALLCWMAVLAGHAPREGAAAEVAGAWKQIGPYGGDVRSLAARLDFSQLFLGTSNAQVYASRDAGRSWSWLSEVVARPDYVVDHILIDPLDSSTLYAGVWSTEPNGGGGVFKSTDAGRAWRSLPAMAGQSVRSLAQSASHPRLLVAGSLEGVFRTQNAGQTWERISPAQHQELHSIESLAIDPKDPEVVYAGTWHLPWKTADGGRTWSSLKNGMIDDSDVFSIIVDWSNNNKVYASACSGIYGSSSAGQAWRKIQGIPHSARRTRVIRQDPRNPAVVYAGTTEGLWKTASGGESWRRLTSPKLVVNDIAIDAHNPSRLLLATDRAGLLATADGGESFTESNRGFAHRQVSATAFDPAGGRLYAALLNDKEYGGIHYTEDGREWRQVNRGLDDREVFALVYARGPTGGRLLAAVRDGILALDSAKNTWSPIGRVVGRAPEPPNPARSTANRAGANRAATVRERSSATAAPVPALTPPARQPGGYLRATVNDFFQAGPDQPVYAATNSGLFKSADSGATWNPVSPRFPVTAVAADGNFLVAGGENGLDLSFNGGAYWFHVYLPADGMPGRVNAVALSGELLLAAGEAGLFRSPDRGATWERKGHGMPLGPVPSVRFRPGKGSEVYASARLAGHVYVSDDGGQSFRALERQGLVGSRLGALEILPHRQSLTLLVVSAFDGLFVRELTALAAASGGPAPQWNGR